jgi:hypothetical protein
MALSNGLYSECDAKQTEAPRQEVFRVIDDGDCVLTTLDPYKALKAMQEVMEKHDITACWFDVETLR